VKTASLRAVVALGLAGLAAGTLLCLGQASARRATWPPEADTYYLPTSNTLRLLSLGHHELASDLVSARGNVYFGTQMINKGEQRWLTHYVNTAIDLDPWFHRLYLSGAAMNVYNGKNVSLPMFEGATALLERGAKVFPLDWEIKFQLGFNYLFEMPQQTSADDPRVPQWRQRGVEALRQAALFEGGPEWLPNLVARVLTKEGSQDMAVRHLEQAYTVAASDEAREQIRNKLIQLKGQQISRQIEEQRLRFQKTIKERYPYAPEAFSVIAPRRPRAISPPLSAGTDTEGGAPRVEDRQP
jgi:hypothetical protein